jgi:hypothetical protein
MKTHILKGSKQEIVEGLTRISGDVRQAIVFVDEPPATAGDVGSGDAEDIFAEMQPFVAEGNSYVDDSREAIYTRLEGE